MFIVTLFPFIHYSCLLHVYIIMDFKGPKDAQNYVLNNIIMQKHFVAQSLNKVIGFVSKTLFFRYHKNGT